MKTASGKLFGVFLFYSMITPLFAANLNVTVYEKGTGDALQGVTVVIKQSGDYDTTNKQGQISFTDIQLPVDIKILNSGYQTLEQKVSTEKLIVYLEPLSYEGETLGVEAERVKEKVSKIILNREELRRVPGTSGDPIKAIETLPGVVTGGGGGGGGGPGAIYIRGSSGGENSVWVNQIPVDYLYHTWNISVVNPSLVKDFNIFLGGFPVEYDDKLGGIIDIQLRDPKTDRLHQNYRVAINESAGLIEGPINEKQSFYIAGRASYIDKVLDPFLDDLSNFFSGGESETDISILTLPKYWDAQANWHYDMEKGSADLYYFGSGDALAFDIKALDTSDPQLIGALDIDFGFHTLGFNTRQTIFPGVTAQLTGSVKRLFEHQTMGQDENGDPFGVDGEYNTSLAHPQIIWTVNNKNELTAGGHVFYGVYPIDIYVPTLPTEENFQGSSFTSLDKFRVKKTVKAAALSPYLKWRWQATEKFNAITGIRASYVRGSGGIELFDYSPRATIEYQATEKLLFTASWGRFIQMPQEAQLLQGYGNPGLGFTQSEHRIIGTQYQATPNWSVTLEAYQKPMDKLVLTYPDLAPPDIYQNTGSGEAYGVDLLIKRKYANRKMGWFSYSFAKSSRTTTAGLERDFSGDQPHTINMVWSQPFWGSWNNWTWGIKLQAHSGRPYTPVVGRVANCLSTSGIVECSDQANAVDDPALIYWDPIFGKRNSKRYPFFHQLDVRIDRLIRYNTWTMNLYLDLQNVTMSQSIISYDYGRDYENYNKPKTTGFPPIILPFLGVEANF